MREVRICRLGTMMLCRCCTRRVSLDVLRWAHEGDSRFAGCRHFVEGTLLFHHGVRAVRDTIFMVVCMLRLATVRVWRLCVGILLDRPLRSHGWLMKYRVLLKTPWSDGTSSIQLNTWELMETERSGVGESPNSVRNRMAFDCVDSTPTFAPGFVSWCFCE